MEQPTEPALVVRGLRKTYGSPEVRALRGVDLTVGRGEFVALMGPSGCGKSTLLHLVAGLDRADEGAVELAGTRSDDLHGRVVVAQGTSGGIAVFGAVPDVVVTDIRNHGRVDHPLGGADGRIKPECGRHPRLFHWAPTLLVPIALVIPMVVPIGMVQGLAQGVALGGFLLATGVAALRMTDQEWVTGARGAGRRSPAAPL